MKYMEKITRKQHWLNDFWEIRTKISVFMYIILFYLIIARVIFFSLPEHGTVILNYDPCWFIVIQQKYKLIFPVPPISCSFILFHKCNFKMTFFPTIILKDLKIFSYKKIGFEAWREYLIRIIKFFPNIWKAILSKAE